MSKVKVDRIEDVGGMYGFETREVLNALPRNSNNAPTKRADGSALQFGDKYFNSAEQLDYIYKDTGWVVNDIVQFGKSTGATKVGAKLASGADSNVQSAIAEVEARLKPLADYTALRAYNGSAESIRITQSGIAGIFQLDLFDTTSVDNGGTVIVGTSGKRWKREFSLEVDARWFGVKGGGVVDDAPALQIALNSGAKVINVTVPAIRIVSSVNYKFVGQKIRGLGVEATRIIAETAANDSIICQSLNGCSLELLKIVGRNNTAGSSLAVRDSAGFRMSGCRLEQGFNGVEFNRINDCGIDKSVIADLKGEFGVKFLGDLSYKSDVLNITDTIFSHFNNPTIKGIHWQSYAHSMTLENVRIIKGGQGLFTENSSGVLSSNSYPSFLQMALCEFDFQQNESIRLENMQDAWITNLYTHGSASKDNIYVGEQTKGVRFVTPRSASAFMNGIYFAGSAGQIIGGEFYSNSQSTVGMYDGIYVAPTAKGLVIGPVISGDANTSQPTRQNFGLNIAPGATNIRYAPNCDFNGNVNGTINAQADLIYENGGNYRHFFKNKVGLHLSIGGSVAGTSNNFRISGSAPGVSIKLISEGSDTNISPEIVPKGTGALIIGARNYASDADAASGGVPIGGTYHTSGTLKVRLV